MRARIVLVSMLLLTAVSLFGCAAAEKPASSRGAGSAEATVATPGAKVKGSMASGEPAELPLWPGATVVASALSDAASGQVFALTLLTQDKYAGVLNGTAVGFQKQGWSVSSSDARSGELKGSSLSVTKGGTSGMVTVSETASGTVTLDYVICLAQ